MQIDRFLSHFLMNQSSLNQFKRIPDIRNAWRSEIYIEFKTNFELMAKPYEV